MNTPVAAPPPAETLSFIARDIAGAVAEIRAKLGPDAEILDIRRLPPRGIARLWQNPRIEVLARLPDKDEPPTETNPRTVRTAPTASPQTFHAGVSHQEAMQRYAQTNAAAGAVEATPAPIELAALSPELSTGARRPSPWRCAAVLDRLGLLPLHVERVLNQMQELHGADRPPPGSMTQELALARAALLQLWRQQQPSRSPGGTPLHVFIGPHGSGKSTVLCKWLAKAVLLEGQQAHVWRLDGRTANASELVSIYGEILGVQVKRHWHGREDPSRTGFVDLPGAEFHDAASLTALKQALGQFPSAQVHLVLNAAYTIPLLLNQIRASAALPVSDLILTHLDEETAWSKLWNLALGTNFPLSLLSVGQNIPGRLCAAQPELLCASLFSANRPI